MLQRRKADDTIRETEVPNGTKISPSFIDSDIVASTVPLHKLTKLHARYHNIKKLLFTPSIDTPQLKEILLRGNRMVIDHWDFTNCVHIEKIENSMGLLKAISLPPRSQDEYNFFDFCYIGHFYEIYDYRDGNNYEGQSPPEVIDALIERAYFSNISYSSPNNIGTRYKQFSTDPNNGHLYHGANRTLPYHKILAQERNWNIKHLSLESFNVELNSNAQTKSFHLYNSTSAHEIDVNLPDNPTWLSLDKNYFYPDVNNIQNLNITVTANDTGAPRSTIIWFRKLKTYDNLHEMHYKAKVVVTQAG
jgi:hypothetical protein